MIYLSKGIMRLWLGGITVAVLIVSHPHRSIAQQQSPSSQSIAALQTPVEHIIAAATSDSAAWQRMALWTDTFGPRLSGSSALEKSIDWALAELKREGFTNVHGEQVMVPHWVRGEESAMLVTPRQVKLHMLGLGGSVGTPAGGITASVLVVSSFDELTKRASEARGKIVLFDAPFVDYGTTVTYRARGASAAARVGAVAALIRSISSASMQNPHTGAMSYDSTVVRIPVAAVSIEDAMMLHRMSVRGDSVVVRLSMNAQQLPDAPSRNIIAELKGREYPDEVVVVSGHIDSWDVGQGAMDDAGGFMAAWEAMLVLKRLGFTPHRTIRLVGWTNEENGGRGEREYHNTHASELGKHAFAIESDYGVFQPTGARLTGDSVSLRLLRQVAAWLAPIGAASLTIGEAASDLGLLANAGVPTLEPEVDDSRYFWYHHSEADTPDKLDPAAMARCVAVMAAYAYVAAEIPGRFRGAVQTKP